MTRTRSRPAIKTRQPTGNRFPIAIGTLAVLAVAAAAWWAFGTGQARPQPPRNLLLITVDTLRADAIGAYGNARAATPWLDRLASSGVRFDNAHAHTVVTLPSHANILTGRLPPDHGVRDNSGFRVPPGEESLATRLKTLGVIDKVIAEPLGGAHRDHAEAAKSLKKAIQDGLRSLQDLSPDALLERRQERWVNYGKFKELAE